MQSLGTHSSVARDYRTIWSRLLLVRPLHFVLWTLAAYLGTALLFAALYSLTPGGLVPAAGGAPPVGFGKFAEALHVSSSMQSTLVYANASFTGCGKYLATVHGIVALVLQAVFLALLVFRVLKSTPKLEFARYAVFDPVRDCFTFRFANTSPYDVINADFHVHVGRYLTDPTSGGAKSGYSLKMETDNSGTLVWIPSGLFFRERTVGASAVFRSTGHRFSPVDAEVDDLLLFDIHGAIRETNSAFFARVRYDLGEVRCGVFEDAQDDPARLSSHKSTEGEYCLKCKYFSGGCKLDVAARLRRAPVTPNQ